MVRKENNSFKKKNGCSNSLTAAPVSAPCKFTMRCVLFLLEMETVDPIKPLRTLCNVDEDNRTSMREAINEENP